MCHSTAIKGIETEKLQFQKAVEECVRNSFDSKGEKSFTKDSSKVLEANMQDWKSFGSFTFPAVAINGVKFVGQLNPDNVFEELCEGFISMPYHCRKYLRKEGLMMNTPKGMSNHQLILILMIILVINFVLFMIYKQYLNKELDKELRIQVSSEVSRYVALSQIAELN